nr:MAG TPA: chromosome partition protein [Bacteriophage sp.]
MRIKHIFLQNFCKFYGSNVVDTDLYNRTEVSGVNESGKSTIKRAIQYIFGCRDENGREITGIRPHDKDGNDIDGDITAEVTVEIDGTDKVLKKVCRQNFNKKGEFTGNVTDYYVNDIPKNAADFEAFLEESVCGKDKFSLCINAMTLLLKGGTDQRAILADMFGQHSNDDICNQFSEFEALRTVLQDGTVDELKKRCNAQLYGTRGRNGTKGLQDLLDEIPSRIDEVSRQRVQIDLSELELQKNALLEKLNANIEQQNDNQKRMAEYDKLSDGIIELKMKLGDLEHEAYEKNSKKREELNELISAVKEDTHVLDKKINDAVRFIKSKKEDIEDLKEKKELQKKLWENAKSRTFDESTLVCSYCGQEYPEEKKEQLRANFETHKAEELAKITENGTKFAEEIKRLSKNISEANVILERLNTERSTKTSEIMKLEEQLKAIPAKVDVSGTDEYKAIQSQIADKEAAMNCYADMQSMRIELKCVEEEIRADIEQVNKKLSSVSINESVDKRIAELEQERKNIAQKITDVQAQLDLLKKFSRKKNELLEADVNKYLCFCTVRMFRPLVNGDTEECCDFTYRGEPYSRNMNHGARILTEIDICNAFQKRCGVELPIMVDDTESLDPWKIPDVDSQLIMFHRSDDAVLKVEEVKNA